MRLAKVAARRAGARLVLAAAAVLALAAPAARAQSANLTSLHDALQLSAAQEPAWRLYVGATGPDVRASARREQAGRLLPSLTTPRRLDLISAAMEQDLADFRAKGQAVRGFYSQLSPAQRAIFDRQTLALSGARDPSAEPRPGYSRP